MIAPSTIREIHRLLDQEEMPHNAIAERTGVSRGTIHAIASGRRPDRDDLEEPVGPPARCPGCGGTVYLPCRLCWVRSLPPRRRRNSTRRDHGPPKTHLKPPLRLRYDEVRATRLQATGTLAMTLADRRPALGPGVTERVPSPASGKGEKTSETPVPRHEENAR